MAHPLTWSKQAQKDLYDIFHFLATTSDMHAEFVTGSIIEATRKLESFPHLGRVAAESNHPSLRELLVVKYRVFYYLTDDGRIDILAVRHSSRPFQDTILPN